MQDLWQGHYQILPIILLNVFIKLNVNVDTMIKKYDICGIKYKDCECFLEYTNCKDNLIEYKCLCSRKNYQKSFHKNLKKRVFNTCKFSNYDINKFILLLRKGFILMNIWMIENN